MFGTSGIRGQVGTDITGDLALDVGRALATDGADTIVIGRDARDAGEAYSRALTAGITECGGDVVDIGVQSTPTVARHVVRRDADAGVVVTASHNPSTDNGFKLWRADGRAFGDEENDRIARIVREEAFAFAAWDGFGTHRRDHGARAAHEREIHDAVSIPSDLTVVVDIGNGVGRITADTLHSAGCHVETLNGQRDGRFPGRPSEPTADNCRSAQALVSAIDADLGIVHDGDADRMVAIDDRGRFVSGDTMLALFASRTVGDGERVAAPVNTSLIVADVLSDMDSTAGATVTYTKVGDAYIAERTTESDVVFGGEPSGAWIWPQLTPCPDGPLAACKLAALVDEEGPLSALVDSVPNYPIRRESVRTESKGAVMDRVADRALEGFDSVSTLDGIRVETDTGWFLVRASGTEALVRITAEARAESDADELLEQARRLVDSAVESR